MKPILLFTKHKDHRLDEVSMEEFGVVAVAESGNSRLDGEYYASEICSWDDD
jgi:hypothetical protein